MRTRVGHHTSDFLGDSLELCNKAAEVEDRDIIVFCGVDFMAETAYMLNPDKKVLIPDIDAECPMAHMLTGEQVREAKENTLPLEVREAIELRIILDDTKTLLYALFPPHAQHSWSDSDFCNAAAFFRCDYPITKEFLKIQFPEIPKGRVSKNQENCYLFYRYYRGKYLEMDAKEDSPLSIGREEWKRLKKKATV